jgi:hypothetical protein
MQRGVFFDNCIQVVSFRGVSSVSGVGKNYN